MDILALIFVLFGWKSFQLQFNYQIILEFRKLFSEIILISKPRESFQLLNKSIKNIIMDSKIKQQNIKAFSSIIIIVIFCLLSLSNSQLIVSDSAPQLKLTATEEKNILSSINGISLEGNWNCIDDYFYKPLKQDQQCLFFKIPKSAKTQLNQEQDFLSDYFFKGSRRGKLQAFFWSSQSYNIADQLHIIMYRFDNNYKRDQIIQFNLDLSTDTIKRKFMIEGQDNETKLSLVQGKNLITTVSLYDQRKQLVKFDIMADIEISIIGHNNYNNLLQASKNYQLNSFNTLPYNLPINIRLVSQSIRFESKMERQSYSTTFIFLLITTLIQSVFLLINPTTSAQQNVSKARTVMFRISQWFILHMYSFIFYFSSVIYIGNLGMQYYDTELGYLVFVGLINIGIGMLFLRRYEMVLQKFTNKIKLLMALVFVIGYFWIVNRFMYSHLFWILQISVMLLYQILYSMQSGGKGGLPKDLIAFMLVSRIPLFSMILYEKNAIGMHPIPINSSIFILFILSIAFFLTIIQLQSSKGGQFMIPNQIIPGFYDYYFQQDSQDEKMKQQCPICTTPINKAPDFTYQLTQVQNQTDNSDMSSSAANNKGKQVQDIITHQKVRFMKTPCNHIFHIDCLTKWMQAKLVCPYCRSTLPQLASLQKQ